MCASNCIDGVVITDRTFPVPTMEVCGRCTLGRIRAALARGDALVAWELRGELHAERDGLLHRLDQAANFARRADLTGEHMEAHRKVLIAADLFRGLSGVNYGRDHADAIRQRNGVN